MYTDILRFWFEELTPEQWWKKDSEIDQHIRIRFRDTWEAARRAECAKWRDEPLGRLAEIIVLDQFSRNLFRDKPQAFAQDGMALVLSQEAIRNGIANEKFTDEQLAFVYMPFMHSESRMIHEQAVKLFEMFKEKSHLDYELKHKAIIDRFGRYPHRNAVLGRDSTPDEKAFLQQPDSSF